MLEQMYYLPYRDSSNNVRVCECYVGFEALLVEVSLYISRYVVKHGILLGRCLQRRNTHIFLQLRQQYVVLVYMFASVQVYSYTEAF